MVMTTRIDDDDNNDDNNDDDNDDNEDDNYNDGEELWGRASYCNNNDLSSPLLLLVNNDTLNWGRSYIDQESRQNLPVGLRHS